MRKAILIIGILFSVSVAEAGLIEQVNPDLQYQTYSRPQMVQSSWTQNNDFFGRWMRKYKKRGHYQLRHSTTRKIVDWLSPASRFLDENK